MLEARNISFRFGTGRMLLDRVDIAVKPGEVTGLTGPSGRGKSTLGRILAGHVRPLSGFVRVDGAALDGGLSPVQYLHQSPILAMNPRWRIGRIVEEAWEPDAASREQLSVSRRWYNRFPHEISGGELQRVAILRALAPSVRYLVADEITAMLDPITQAEVWAFLMACCRERGLGVLAISHDRMLLKRIAKETVTLGVVEATPVTAESTRLSLAMQ